MASKFTLLSETDEPTDEQLHLLMEEVLKEVVVQKKKGDENLENQKSSYQHFIYEKYHALTSQTNGK